MVEILAKAGVPTGKDLRGPAMALYVVAEASDGYRAIFALAELDPAFTDRVILLADRRDGKPLSAREGPLQMIVPGEKKHARWVRQVIRLKVGRGRRRQARPFYSICSTVQPLVATKNSAITSRWQSATRSSAHIRQNGSGSSPSRATSRSPARSKSAL